MSLSSKGYKATIQLENLHYFQIILKCPYTNTYTNFYIYNIYIYKKVKRKKTESRSDCHDKPPPQLLYFEVSELPLRPPPSSPPAVTILIFICSD